MKTLLKKLARKILSRELAYQENDRKRLHDLAYGRHEKIMLPIAIVEQLVGKLPPANAWVNMPGAFANYNIASGQMFKTEYGKFFFEARRIDDYREDRREPAICFETTFGNRFCIPAVCATMSTRVMGIDTEVNTWSWDMFRSGIRIISEGDFERILTFVQAQQRVLKSFE